MGEDLDFALRTIVEQGDNIHEWRNQRMDELQALGKALLPERPYLDAGRGYASRRVSSHVHLERLDLARAAALWPDHQLLTLVQGGAQVVGHLPHSGIYREAAIQPSITVEEQYTTNQNWAAEILAMRPPKRDEAKVLWEKTLEERDLGLLVGFWTKD